MSEYSYLYVEDDRLSRDVMRLLMNEIAGITRYAEFENSENFLDRLRALPHRPDVILLDIHMYPNTGFQLLEMIRSDPDYRHCQVIAVTASVMNEEIAQLRTSGFDGTIGKPLDAMKFSSIIQRIQAGDSVWEIM